MKPVESGRAILLELLSGERVPEHHLAGLLDFYKAPIEADIDTDRPVDRDGQKITTPPMDAATSSPADRRTK